MKKNSAVVFGLTSNYTFAAACVIMDLKRLSQDCLDEIIILHDGICKNDRKALEAIYPVRFIKYRFPIKNLNTLSSRAVQQFTKMVFTKFECLRLLDEYKNVMWMDYDIVLQSNVLDLLLPCESGIKMMPGGLPVRGQLYETVKEYNMEAEGVCASLFVFHDNLSDYNNMYNFCYKSLLKYADILYMPEQAIFDFMIQKYNLSPVLLDGKVYSAHPLDAETANSAKIIHAYGHPKFWNGIYNQQWLINYNTWLELGGAKYKPVKFKFRTKLLSMVRRFSQFSHYIKKHLSCARDNA